MAKYYIDFSGYLDENAFWEEWTPKWNATEANYSLESGTSGHTGGKYLLNDTSASGTYTALAFDPALNADTVEIALRAQARSGEDFATADPTGYADNTTPDSSANYNRANNPLAQDTDNGIQIVDEGTSNTIGSHAVNFGTGTWVWARFQTDGVDHKASWWEDGTGEPSSWHVEGTDNSNDGAPGWVGWQNSAFYTAEFDVIGIGTNGDSAPVSASEVATVGLTWDDNSTNEDGFYVYRTTVSSPTFPDDYYRMDDLPVDTTNFTDSQAPANTTVHYAVTAYNADGESSPTTDSVDTTAGPTPVNVSASGSGAGSGTSAVVRQRHISASALGEGAGVSDILRSRHVGGSGSGTGSGSAEVRRRRSVAAAGSGQGAGSATARRYRTFAGTGSGSGTGAGDIRRILVLQADGSGEGVGNASVSVSFALVASGNGRGVGNASLSTTDILRLAATGLGAGTGAGDILARRTLSATGAGAGVGDATVRRIRQFAASGAGEGVATANLVRVRPISATGLAEAEGAGELHRSRLFSAAGEGAGAGSAEFRIIIPLSGSGAGIGTGGAELSEGILRHVVRASEIIRETDYEDITRVVYGDISDKRTVDYSVIGDVIYTDPNEVDYD